MAQFAVAGAAALAVFLAGSLVVLSELGRRESIREARDFAVVVAQGIVEPNLSTALLAGDEGAARDLDALVQERVLGDRIVRVKVWTREGRIVFSDEARLIGSTYALGPDGNDVLLSGVPHVEKSDLEEPENRFERGQGSLYEVYVRVRAPDGTPLLVETYQRSRAVGETGGDVWRPFAIPLLVSLLLLWLVQVPLAWRLARRLRQSQEVQEGLLIQAVEASATERRRIAADLHDGVVQDLAGISFSLNAAASGRAARQDPELAETLADAATGARGAVRQLRTLLVEIHPATLRAHGLAAALVDLLAPLSRQGIETELDVPEDADISPPTERLLFRAAAEALRNAQRHAGARRVSVQLQRVGPSWRLEVVDDGKGFTAQERTRSGHLGLTLVEDIVRVNEGTFQVISRPGEGTRFLIEVPS